MSGFQGWPEISKYNISLRDTILFTVGNGVFPFSVGHRKAELVCRGAGQQVDGLGELIQLGHSVDACMRQSTIDNKISWLRAGRVLNGTEIPRFPKSQMLIERR